MIQKNSNKSFIYAVMTVLMWSTVATAFKIGLRHLGPSNLLFYSSLTSLLFFSILIFYSKSNQYLFSLKNISKSILLGFLNPFLYYLILFEAYRLLPAQIAQPLNYTWVIVVTLLMAAFMNQKLEKNAMFGLIISFVGVVLLSSAGSIPGVGDISIWGVTLALSSSIFWGVYWLLNVRDIRDDKQKLFLNFFFGTLFITVYIFFTDGFEFDLIGLYSGIYIGLFEMGITFFVWLKALKYSENTAITGNIIYLSPFLSLVFINIFLSEQISSISFFGLTLIIVGILFPRLIKVIRKLLI